MITLYTWSTPNGRKVSIALEEMGLAYEVKPVDINRDEQFSPEFLAMAPNNKIPAILDHQGAGGPISVFESGAILQYLAEKTGKFLARDGAARYRALEWVFWQVSGQGPMFGQLGYFVARSEEKSPEAIGRFTAEAQRLLGVLERRLTSSEYVAGDDYTIADIACYSWTYTASTMLKFIAPSIWGDLPSVERWLVEVGARPAVQRGMNVPG